MSGVQAWHLLVVVAVLIAVIVWVGVTVDGLTAAIDERVTKSLFNSEVSYLSEDKASIYRMCTVETSLDALYKTVAENVGIGNRNTDIGNEWGRDLESLEGRVDRLELPWWKRKVIEALEAE